VTAGFALALAASLSWGFGDFVNSFKTRTLGVLATLVPGQVAGLVVIAVIVGVRGHGWPGAHVLLAIPAAIGGTIGLAAFLRGVRAGAISVVAPLAGLSAVIPVVFGVATGDRISAAAGVGIAAAILGVMLASREPGEHGGGRFAAGAGWGLLAALGWGVYFPPLHAASRVDPYWAVLVFRCTSVVLCVGALLIMRGRLPGRRELPIVAAAGLLDMAGNLLYGLASQRGVVSTISVLASLYPIVTVALAMLVLRERVSRLQLVGTGLTFAGIGLISSS
jgi:drug/metabolite transporter (DMT)-like permease